MSGAVADRQRVVVADDSRLMRRMLADALGRQGFDVVATAGDGDGDEALAACRVHRPDALTLDLAMPGPDGLGVLRALREGRERPVPVVVVSAFSPARDRHRHARRDRAERAGEPGARRRRRADARLRAGRRGLGLLDRVHARALRGRRRRAAGAARAGVMETMVRMGELAISDTRGDVLVSLGLGSCIGLAVVDKRAGVAGLAHIVLPATSGTPKPEAMNTFADHAVPALVDGMVERGAARVFMQASLVGGASMFAGAGLEVGSRNATAVRDLVAARRPTVVAEAVGGSRGRTVKVDVASGTVSVREAGGTEEVLAA